MSTTFTTPANATWQTLLNELTLAYSERRQTIGQSAYTPEDDTDVQAASYWTAIQDWIETNCVSFIDHISGPLSGTPPTFLYFTLATFRSAAGLNACGFRRVPEGVEWNGVDDPTWSYGQMQAGDIIGPWIFEDLQAAFSVLLQTVNSDLSAVSVANSRRHSDATSLVDCGAAYTEALTLWAAASYEDWTGGYTIGVRYYDPESPPDAGGFFALERWFGNWKLNAKSTCRPYALDVYLLAEVPSTIGDLFFADLDARGWAENGFYFMESIAETSDAFVLTSIFGNDATDDPLTLSGVVCPLQATSYTIGCQATAYGLYKWNFTNA